MPRRRKIRDKLIVEIYYLTPLKIRAIYIAAEMPEKFLSTLDAQRGCAAYYKAR